MSLRYGPDGVLMDEIAPGAVLDYAFDWSSWLSDGETITSSSWAVAGGGQITSEQISDGKAVAFVTCEEAGTVFVATNSIVTSAGRHDSRSIRFFCALL